LLLAVVGLELPSSALIEHDTISPVRLYKGLAEFSQRRVESVEGTPTVVNVKGELNVTPDTNRPVILNGTARDTGAVTKNSILAPESFDTRLPTFEPPDTKGALKSEGNAGTPFVFSLGSTEQFTTSESLTYIALSLPEHLMTDVTSATPITRRT
jgi:hypothetical protein